MAKNNRNCNDNISDTVFMAGQSPTCILHGEQLRHVEGKLDDLHKSLYQNGFQTKITEIALDSRLALERVKTNNKLIWAIFSTIIATAVYVVWHNEK